MAIKLDHLGYVTAEMIRDHLGDGPLVAHFRRIGGGLAPADAAKQSAVIGMCLLARDDPAADRPNLVVGSESGFSWLIRRAD